MTAPTLRSTLWLIDRTRVADGRGTCQRMRALGFHLGPNGYGITMKGTKLPLMTGIGLHELFAPILEWCRDHDDVIVQALEAPLVEGETLLLVPREVIRASVKAAQQAYAKVVQLRGFAYLDDEDHKAVVREQNYLLEGLAWAWCLEVLPELLRRGRILEVEHDGTYVFGCTCELGNGIGTKDDHETRGCEGIGIMCRPDFLLETRTTKELEYHEFKSTGMDSITFRDKWEVMMQMFAATLDAERRHGKHVGSIYIHGLVKGKREGEYNPETGDKSGVYRQQSPFCYGFKKAANPPMEVEEWAAAFKYFDEVEQRNRTLGKAYKKTGLWELPDQWVGEGQSKGEVWAEFMPSAVRRKQLIVIGPLDRQTQMVEHFLQECEGEEGRVRDGLWALWECANQILTAATRKDAPAPSYWADVWPHADYQKLLDEVFPRSYECRRWGKRNRCQFEDPCLQREGWADPVGSGKFIERRPHHADELQQAIDRGLLLPEVGAAEDISWEND